MPIKVPPPPKKWDKEFRRMVDDLGMESLSLEEAYGLLYQFLNPVLTGEPPKEWDPDLKAWIE